MNLPLEIRGPRGEAEGTTAQTRDVSFRGLYFEIDREVEAGSPIEFVLVLPKEVTLAKDVRVRCAGRIVRVEKKDSSNKAPGRVGVAAEIDQYEFMQPGS
jgi:hypothetical protein